MLLSSFLNPEFIFVNYEPNTNDFLDLTKEILNKVNEKYEKYDINSFFKYFEEDKTKIVSLGESILYPHLRVSDFDDILLSIVILKEPISDPNKPTIDGIPIKLIILSIIDEKHHDYSLKIMSAFSRLIREFDFINKLNSFNSVDEIIQFIENSEIKIKDIIDADDLMQEISVYVKPSFNLFEVAQLMHIHKFELLPVVDDEMKYLGAISVKDIFEYTMPYLKLLHTVSFMNNIDPIEELSNSNIHRNIEGLYNKNYKPILNNTSITEILFEMVKNNKHTLFVVNEDNKLVGMIKNYTIIDLFISTK